MNPYRIDIKSLKEHTSENNTRECKGIKSGNYFSCYDELYQQQQRHCGMSA
jgi:hypothetical protein